MTANKQRYFVPAAPGFWELSLVDCGNGEYEAERTPIIAWEMVADAALSDGDSLYYAYPVTIEGERTHRASTPILEPEGRVRIACDTTYFSAQDWLRAASAEARAALTTKGSAPALRHGGNA
jgi:hypothetical protein